MALKSKKIIHKNLPTEGALGQYNFNNSLNDVSIKGDMSMYSLSLEYTINENKIEDFRYRDLALFDISLAEILVAIPESGTDSNHHDFKAFLVDSTRAPDIDSIIDYDSVTGTFSYKPNAYSVLSDNLTPGGANYDYYRIFRAWEDIDAGWTGGFRCGDDWAPGDLVNWVGSPDTGELGDGFGDGDHMCAEWSWDIEDPFWQPWNDWYVEGSDNFSIVNFPNPSTVPVSPPIDGCCSSWSGHFSTRIFSGEFIYLILNAEADDQEWLNQNRKESFTVYPIPKSILDKLWRDSNESAITATFSFIENAETIIDNESYTYQFPRPTYIEGGSGLEAKYKGGDVTLSITLTSEKDFGYRDGWCNTEQNEFWRLKPGQDLDYQFSNLYLGSMMRESDAFDFRPISFVAGNQYWDFDLQQFYEFGDGYVLTTAPNRIGLGFHIAKNSSLWYPEYYDGYDDEVGEVGNLNITLGSNTFLGTGVRFMMGVYDWEAQDSTLDAQEWTKIYNSFPTNLTELIYKNQKGLFEFENVYESSDGENFTLNQLEHQYDSPGIKIIKALVFSYIPLSHDYPQVDPYYITPIRWKAVTIKLHLGLDLIYVEDFGDIGGFDYNFIPWPETTAMVSGVSPESTYANSLEQIIQKNFFKETEILDRNLAELAYDNLPGRQKSELGKYPGKQDIAQIRYFEAPYTMDELLMIDEGIDGEDWVKYDNTSQWYDYDSYPDNPKYPRNEEDSIESCVGLLFIKEDPEIDRMKKCLIELNMIEVRGITLRDTSGHDNRGLLIGDYSIDKSDYDTPLSREEPTELPEVGTEKLAF